MRTEVSDTIFIILFFFLGLNFVLVLPSFSPYVRDYLSDITNTGDMKNGRKPQQEDGDSIRKGNVDVRRQDLQKDSNLTRKSNGEVRRQDLQKNCDSARKDDGEFRSQEVPKARKPTVATHKSSKPKDIPNPPIPGRPSAKATTCRNNTQQRQKIQDNSGELRVAARTPEPKASKPHDISIDQAPRTPLLLVAPHRNAQQRQKPSGVLSKPCHSRKDVSVNISESIEPIIISTSSLHVSCRYQGDLRSCLIEPSLRSQRGNFTIDIKK